MSSREHELDYADDPLSLRDSRRSSGSWKVALICVAALFMILIVGVVITRFMWARSAQAEAVAARQAAVAAAAAAAPKIFERDDFKAVIMLKAEESVIDEFGQPDKTVEDGEKKYLYYRNLTKDPQTGKVDGLIAIELVRGRVVAVEFNPPTK
jgi:hypothetical protein